MRTVGAFAARRQLSALLDRVAQGEAITITRHGKAIARLAPVGTASPRQLEHTVARLKSFRRGVGSADFPPSR